MIGEHINPTRRKKLAETIASGDYSLAQSDTLAQMKVGVQVLDINAGIPGANEPDLLRGASFEKTTTRKGK